MTEIIKTTETTTAVNTHVAANAPIELLVKKPVKFHFKKDELGNKRPSVELELKFLTLAGVANIINLTPVAVPVVVGDTVTAEQAAAIEAAIKHNTNVEKQQELLLSALEDTIIVQAREQVNAKVDITQETLDTSKLTWQYIASIPKAERRGAGISKDVWEAFSADYISIMPGLIGRDVEKVTNAATILTKRFQPVKTVKAVIAQLKDYLDVWFSNTSNAEELAEVYEFLSKKADELLSADEAKLLANL